ncbi:MAG TPA: hypothetical protein VI758_02105, partial [Bacteroidota bacterium]
ERKGPDDVCFRKAFRTASADAISERMDHTEDSMMEQPWDSIRQKVCRKCIDGDGKGGCRMPVDDTCSLAAFLPEIVQTVSSVHSDSYQAYIDALRANVCSNCEHQFAGDVCKKRDTLECALDRYYPVVIEVIESVKSAAVGSGHNPS